MHHIDFTTINSSVSDFFSALQLNVDTREKENKRKSYTKYGECIFFFLFATT